MKKLRISVTLTTVLAFLSVLALIFLFLSLSDIANHEEDQVLEWYIAGIGLIVLCAFIISTFVTLGYLLKTPRIWEN